MFSEGPLAGIKVLDMSRVLAGPWATMTLADLGAEVWKIERPGDGDDTRSWKPPQFDGTSTYYLSTNRNKFGLALDFKSERQRAILLDLARKADVFVENYLTGVLARYGLDYESLKKLNPRLIYCSISGYGRTGPSKHRAGYDFIIQAESGLMSINGEAEGQPHKFGIAISDIAAGMSATQAILAALYARERTGFGTAIDIALSDVSISLLSNVASGSLNGKSPAGRYGNAHASIVPYQTFDAAEGSFVLACANNRQFGDLCRYVIERPDFETDPRFSTNSERVNNRKALETILAEIFAQMRREEIVARCHARSVPIGEIRSIEEALASADVLAREMVWSFERGGKTFKLAGSPFRFSNYRPNGRRAPPHLGEHTTEVLARVLGVGDFTTTAARELQRTEGS